MLNRPNDEPYLSDISFALDYSCSVLVEIGQRNHPGTKVFISIDFGGSYGQFVYRSGSVQIISTHIPLAKAIWTLSVVAGVLEKLA